MNSEAQQFCLRWHNYSTSLLASLPRLLDWDDLTDVTLYAGGLSVKAHRIVLSACSQYFKAIFKLNEPPQLQYTSVDGGDLISQLNKGLSLENFQIAMFLVLTIMVHFALLTPISMDESDPKQSPALLEPLKITVITTSLDDLGVRFIPCGREVMVHAFVYDNNMTLYKEKLPKGYQIAWYCHMRVHPICNVQGRSQLSAIFKDLNCGKMFSPLIEIYNEETKYVKHAALEPIRIGHAARNCTMKIDCAEQCEKEVDPGKAVKLIINGIENSHGKPIFGVGIYNGLNGDLLYLGPTFWKLTIKTSPVPFYFKYRIVVSIKSSVLNESCSGVHMFALKKLFAVGIMTDPPTPLRYQGPRRVECGAKCVSLTPYCIHGWLVKPDTCGLKWICNHAACGVTEGTQPLLLRNLPCGQNFTVKLEGDPLVRAAHAHERRIYEWNRVVTIVLQVDRGFWPQRRSVIPEEPIIKQSPNWISSVCRLPGLELPELGPTQHPVIVVPGADFTDLSALVTFMYSGEVTVYRHQLPTLIALADTLAVDGLAHFGKCDDESPPESVEPSYDRGHLELPSPSVHRHGPAKRFKSVDEWAEDGPSTGSVTDSPPCLVPSPTKTMFVRKPQRPPIPLAPSSPPEDLSHKPPETTIKSEDGGGGTSTGPPNSRGPSSKLYATCAVCGKQLSNQYNLRVHMETHRGARYACASCPHVSRSRDALRKHVSYRHPPPSQQPPGSQAPSSSTSGGGSNSVTPSFYHSGPPSS